MAKLTHIFRKQREETREECQRQWLKDNDIEVVQKWSFPTGTWLQKRLAEIQAEKAEPTKTIPWRLK